MPRVPAGAARIGGVAYAFRLTLIGVFFLGGGVEREGAFFAAAFFFAGAFLEAAFLRLVVTAHLLR
jgi:hypothetical protein